MKVEGTAIARPPKRVDERGYLDLLLESSVVFLPLIFFSNEIYELASSPLQALMPENSSMIATQVASPFLSPLKLTFYLSLMISIPYFLSEMWRFIAPWSL